MEFKDTLCRILKTKYMSCVESADIKTLYQAIGDTVSEYISPVWSDCQSAQAKHRRAAYISAEWLIGRTVHNDLAALSLLDDTAKLLAEHNRSIHELEDIEDAALGNGGLGRLAACFIDSAATMKKPLIGYGIRYKYGLFKQTFSDGEQKELPDDWQAFGDPFSIKRYDKRYKIEFADGEVYAVSYDMPIIGWGGEYINTLRLFEAQATDGFDFDAFNSFKYSNANKARDEAELLHLCLYPNDSQRKGKILRLKQEYFLCSAAVQDMLASFEKNVGTDFSRFSEYFAVQLNDTHPVLAIPELVFQLTRRGVGYDDAVKVAKSTFAYTNHTVMAEALEKWDKQLLKSTLPEIFKIIDRLSRSLNVELCDMGLYTEQIQKMKIVDDGVINMARLACGYCYSVNGVAKLHTEIIKQSTLSDWYKTYPHKFCNKTNGITPRRWLKVCNPLLSRLIDEKIGKDWVYDLDRLSELRKFADAPDFLERFHDIKQQNKQRLAEYILKHEGVELNVNSVFDIQIKRLHEYKRQLMNAIAVMYIYYGLKEGSIALSAPLSIIFGAKAAPGYVRAKAVIKYINRIAELINNDKDIAGMLRVVFVKNYNVSYAERLVCAADISEQISTAGTEASGTGNMKFMLNGTPTLGTYDGANIEIVEAAGEENNYIFGARVQELESIRENYDAMSIYNSDEKLRRAVDSLITQPIYKDDEDLRELHTSIIKGADWHKTDHYFILKDLPDYIKTRLRAVKDYIDCEHYTKKCIMNTAAAGRFSSDRTIKEYCDDIWRI